LLCKKQTKWINYTHKYSVKTEAQIGITLNEFMKKDTEQNGEV